MEGKKKEEIGRNEDFGRGIPGTSRGTEEKEKIEERNRYSDTESDFEKERVRLRKERREKAERARKERSRERRKKMVLLLLFILFFVVLFFAFLRRKKLPSNASASSSNLSGKSLRIGILMDLGEEEKSALLRNMEKEKGVEILFLNPKEGKEKLEEELRKGKVEAVIGEGEETAAILSEYSEKEKIPYLALDYGFCLGKSLEDRVVDLSFFAYNEAFRSLGILETEKNDASTELAEAFQTLGGKAQIASYSSKEELQSKVKELEDAGIDILYLGHYSPEGKAILEESHNFAVLLGDDWDRKDFSEGESVKTFTYLYGKEGSPEDAIHILLTAEGKSGKSLSEKLSGMEYEGQAGKYKLKKKGYAQTGNPVFYEFVDGARKQID